MDMEALIKQGVATDFTRTIHREAYATIAPTRPELDHSGKTVLITGGATGIGFAIAQNFAQAHASRIILIGRRESALETARAALVGTPTEILTRQVDQADPKAVRALWEDLRGNEVHVDVLVLSAADFTDAKSILDLGADAVWAGFETNVRGPLEMVQGLTQQAGDRPKAIVNVASQSINMFHESVLSAAAQRPAYGLSKNAGALLLQQIAKDTSPEKLQIVNFHPGVILNDAIRAYGISDETIPFDKITLPGAFAVWAASKEARFLHGRFVWASWDVDEYSVGEVRERIEREEDYLQIGVVGLRGANKA